MPVELTKEQQAEQAHALEQNLAGLRDKRNSLWPAEAAILYQVKANKGWTILDHPSFLSWLQQPDIDMSESHANTLIGAYKTLVIDGGMKLEDLTGVDVTKVREILPAVRQNRATPEDAISDAIALPRTDLRTRYADPKKLKESLKADDEPALCVCKCGHTHKPKEQA